MGTQQLLKIGMIGFGGRGLSLLRNVLLPREDVILTAVCDLYEDRAQEAATKVKERYHNDPLCTTDAQCLIDSPEVDAVIISTAWESHIPLAIAAMKAGKRVAMEVGGAYSLQSCFDLVRVSEETGVPVMLLENCCYGRTELMVLNAERQGVLGEIVHCEGGYCHDLRDEVAFGKENRHYRLRNYQNRNCENYPTHELGPIAKLLHINRGNRMVSLVSVASCAKGLNTFIEKTDKADKSLLNKPFAQGDVITTIITCAGGQTIVLRLDTTLPRYYSRNFTVRGTKGMYEEVTDSFFLDGVHNQDDWSWHKQWGNATKDYREQYEHPIWKEYLQAGVQQGHDGIDWLVMEAFVESAKNKTNPPIDVYDAAAWMAVTALSEQSIALGGTAVSFPDFTNGKWLYRQDHAEGKYNLD